MTVRDEKPMVIMGEWARTGSESAPGAQAMRAASRPATRLAHGEKAGGAAASTVAAPLKAQGLAAYAGVELAAELGTT
jgi:hypothetical protein